MSLWMDNYRPKTLDELSYHAGLTTRMRALESKLGWLPPLAWYGPSGAGKKTKISCVLRELFGKSAERLKIDQRVFLTPSKRKLDVNIVQRNFHIELTPSGVGNYDRVVIQDLLKETAQTQQVDLNAKHRFKVIVINEADLLSRDAQAALIRTMERYMSNMRTILCANSTSSLFAPIKSRCLRIRVAAPSPEEIQAVLQQVAKNVGFDLPPEASEKLAEDPNGNLRKATLVLEALKMESRYLNSPSLTIPKPDWESYCHKVADLITSE